MILIVEIQTKVRDANAVLAACQRLKLPVPSHRTVTADGKLNGQQKHRMRVRRVRFTPLGRHFCSSAQDGTVRLWSVPDFQLLHTFEDPVRDIKSVSISPDERLLAASMSQGRVKIWELSTGKSS